MSKFNGFHDTFDLPIKRGQIITIKKGTMVKTVGKEAKPAGRTYRVAVNHLLPGVTERINGEQVHKSNPKVVWAGAGGYWSEADINDIPEAVGE